MDLYHQVYNRNKEIYIDKTPQSKVNHEVAKNFMPGGETRTICFHKPYPLTIKEGQGAYLFDVDGNRYIDYLNNYTAMIHGHAHESIIAKVQKTLSSGTAYAATVPEQVEFAELLCKRIPGVEKVRFCNSGTEATMFAIRAARTYTKKRSIIKMEGSYHGTHDLAVWTPDSKLTVFPQNIAKDIYLAPFNNIDAIEEILVEKADEIAAIIIEPVMGVAGVIPPEKDYLSNLRKLADQHHVLLIFDEVQTLRLDVGGAQEMFDVIPDLTTMAKIIGGGFPVGAFGGKKEIMDIFNPNNENYLAHGGTFNGNKVSMAAGIVAMNLLDRERITMLDDLAGDLEKRINQTVKQLNIPVTMTRVGSMMNLHFKKDKPIDYASTLHSNNSLIEILHLKLLNRGIFIAPRGMMNLSTVMTKKDIEETANVFSDVLKEMSVFFQSKVNVVG